MPLHRVVLYPWSPILKNTDDILPAIIHDGLGSWTMTHVRVFLGETLVPSPAVALERHEELLSKRKIIVATVEVPSFSLERQHAIKANDNQQKRSRCNEDDRAQGIHTSPNNDSYSEEAKEKAT